MDYPDSSVITVLTYLMPGLVAAAVLYVLTPAPKPVPFERVVQALIYTIVVQALLVAVRTPLVFAGRKWFAIGAWTPDVSLVWSVILAVLIGILSAWADNTDRVHALLRRWGVTLQTSYPSEWFGAFSQNRGYVVLHLKGNRRLYGWAEEWPSVPDRGHFIMTQAEWLVDDKSIDLGTVERLVIPVSDIEMVELMYPHPLMRALDNGRSERANPAPAATKSL
jgi:hypothetical protein